MKNIYDVLSHKEKAYSKVADEHRLTGDTLNKLAAEIQALRLTVKLLADTQEEASQEKSDALSQPQMMRLVLQERGGEMHLADIISRVHAKFGKKLDVRVMAAVLFRYTKRGSTFYKGEKPNTWGLLEFKANDEPKTVMEIVNKIA